MGYNVARFPGQVDQNLLCSICSSVLEEAVLTPCGHSFCDSCLTTWLVRPGAFSCPECRGHVAPGDARPIRSVRSLINAMDIHCDHQARGCQAVVKLDCLKTHLNTCAYSPITCAGCSVVVNRGELPQHHISCAAIAAALHDETDTVLSRTSPGLHHKRSKSATPNLVSDITELTCRVASLELQLKRVKRELDAAELRNRKLERELRQTKQDLEEKRHQLLDHNYVDFEPDYDYGYVASSIAKLSRLISRFLLRKPAYIDEERIYEAVKRCYDNFGRSPSEHGHAMHMLLATAYACNWFSETEKMNIYLWLQSLIRGREAFMIPTSPRNTPTSPRTLGRQAST